MWHAQVSSTLKGAQFAGFIKPSAKPSVEFLEPAAEAGDNAGDKKADPVPNPEYEKWIAKDQQVLSYLFSSLSKEVFSQVSSSTTTTEFWAAIQGLHASQSHAQVMATRMALATASKGTSSVADYFIKMKGLTDEMASVGRKLEDEELVSYILTGLGEDFESVVFAVTARVELISVNELYAQLTSYEQQEDVILGVHPVVSESTLTQLWHLPKLYTPLLCLSVKL
jgi:hypothetical protein